MHEMALARDVLNTVVGAAEGSGAKEVRTVYMTIGSGRDIVNDLFEGLFSHLARGTVAEKAALAVTRVPIRVRCRRCGEVYPLNVYDAKTWDCPACAQKDYALYSGMEFRIDRIEVA